MAVTAIAIVTKGEMDGVPIHRLWVREIMFDTSLRDFAAVDHHDNVWAVRAMHPTKDTRWRTSMPLRREEMVDFGWFESPTSKGITVKALKDYRNGAKGTISPQSLVKGTPYSTGLTSVTRSARWEVPVIDLSEEDDKKSSSEKTPVIKNPNGTEYVCRWVKRADDSGDRMLCRDFFPAMMEIGQHVALIGPPGTGKSFGLKSILGWDKVFTYTCGRTTTADDLLGSWTRIKGEWVWVDGVATIAAQIPDSVIFVDELARAEGDFLSPFFNFMEEEEGELRIPGRPGGEVVKAVGRTMWVYAWNDGVRGAYVDPAQIRRTANIHWSTRWDIARRVGVSPTFIRMATALNDLLDAEQIDWAPQLGEALKFKKLESVMGTQWALECVLTDAPKEYASLLVEEAQKAFKMPVKPFLKV